LYAGADNCTSDALSLPGWRDSKRPEQGSSDATSDYAALRENSVPCNLQVNRPDKRDGDCRIAQQVSHKRKQVFVRKHFWIQRLNRSNISLHALAYLDLA